MMPQEHHIS